MGKQIDLYDMINECEDEENNNAGEKRKALEETRRDNQVL